MGVTECRVMKRDAFGADFFRVIFLFYFLIYHAIISSLPFASSRTLRTSQHAAKQHPSPHPLSHTLLLHPFGKPAVVGVLQQAAVRRAINGT